MDAWQTVKLKFTGTAPPSRPFRADDDEQVHHVQSPVNNAEILVSDSGDADSMSLHDHIAEDHDDRVTFFQSVAEALAHFCLFHCLTSS